jgi:DNA integrity scanning protein DisA with diadenylate cyclase activity
MKLMSKIGPYDKKDLAEKLVNISDEEMQTFHKNRMKNYRLYYILAIILGVLSVIFIFLRISWISITSAVIGFIIVNIVSFKRNRWKRIYENLLYLKKERQKKKNEMDKGKNKDKYRRSGINK